MSKFKWTDYLLLIVLGALSIPLFSILLGRPFDDEAYKELIHISGETAARLFIVTLLISPLRALFKKNRFLRFLLKRRRWIGLASFIYILSHISIYIAYNYDIDKIISDFANYTYLFGWIALIIFLPVAISSNNYSVNNLGIEAWKYLQRLVYPAALFVVLHWLLKETGASLPVLIHFTPLLILELFRIYLYLKKRNK